MIGVVPTTVRLIPETLNGEPSILQLKNRRTRLVPREIRGGRGVSCWTGIRFVGIFIVDYVNIGQYGGYRYDS